MSRVMINHLSKEYVLKSNFLNQLRGKSGVVSALSDISFSMEEGEIVGLVGESGCGKTTLGKVLVRIEDITSGQVTIDGKDISKLNHKDLVDFRKKVQIVFQDPYDSLDPKYTVFDIVAEPIKNLKLATNKECLREKVFSILRLVELTPPEQFVNRNPHQLSGGQRQRVSIARALVVSPKFIVADEPVSMLDVSIRAGILNLLQKLNRDTRVGILLITHDLATARFLCDRIIVMYLGKLVEITKPQDLVDKPCHPYSQLLLSSAPDLFNQQGMRVPVIGEAASAVVPPKGCRFSPRCLYAADFCHQQEPLLREISHEHMVACHLSEQLDLRY